MDHFSSCICLLVVVGNCYGIKLTDRIISFENARRIFPSYSRTSFHLSPRNLGVVTGTNSTLGYKIINPAFSIFITWKPVLNGGVFDFCMSTGVDFYYGSMQLIFVTLRSGTTFQIGYIRRVIRYNQCTLKLARICGINPEIGRQFHGTTHPFGDVTKRSIRKYSGI